MLSFLRKNKGLSIFLGSYYAIYTFLAAVVEPFGWFGLEDSLLKPLGLWGNVLLLLLPAGIALVYQLTALQKQQVVKDYLGLQGVSSGSGRDEAFQGIRQRAKHRIVVVGIGMTNLSRYARRTLSEQAKRVPVDLLMIDPDFLKSNRQFAQKLEEFLDIPDFTTSVRSSFETLKSFCEAWNNDPQNSHKIRLKVFSTIPTMSMVMIDPDEESAEIVIEFFLYQSGEYRPRFHLVPIEAKESLFNRVKSEYIRLWSSARRVV